MKRLAFLAISLLTTPAFAMSLECASSNGKVRISANQKEGGAAPYPGLQVGNETWVYGGKTVGTKIQRYLQEDEVTGQMGEFLEGTEVIVDNSKADEKPMGTVKYTVKVRAPKSDASSAKVKVTVLCTKRFATVPIP